MYTPNRIPLSTRTWNALLSLFLLAYGGIGIYLDDIFIPGKRSAGTHFHGVPAWLLYTAMVSAALNMLSVVADHYDTRNNEYTYQSFLKLTQTLGCCFFILALILDLALFKLGNRH